MVNNKPSAIPNSMRNFSKEFPYIGEAVDIYFGENVVHLVADKSFASQVTRANKIYVIYDDFDLQDQTVSIPENCVLEFDGGSLSNGTIILDNTIVRRFLRQLHGLTQQVQ